jgi:hypothetical protein
MNIIIGTVGAHLTLGLLSSVTSAVNGVFTFCTTISKSASSGAEEVKHIIKETDLEVRVKHAQSLLCELKLDEKSPYTLQQCVQSIYDSIKEISDELDKIHYRMQYNDNLWFGSPVRAYKFHNCRARLDARLKNLDARCKTLVEIIPIQGYLIQNKELDDPSKYVLQIDQIDPSAAKRTREELHKKLTYINK